MEPADWREHPDLATFIYNEPTPPLEPADDRREREGLPDATHGEVIGAMEPALKAGTPTA